MKARPWLIPAVLSGSALVLGLAIVSRIVLRGPTARLPTQVLGPPPTPQCTERYYAASLQEAAERYRTPRPSLEEMGRPLRGGVEFEGARRLALRAVMTTPRLRLVTSVARLRSSVDGTQGFTTDHLLLTITNRTDVPLAYRVVTSVPDPQRCIAKAVLSHNVIALRPRETVRRTECLYHDGKALTVQRVDAYEVTEVGHRYLSRLEPTFDGAFDDRVSRGHDRGDLQGCAVTSLRSSLPDVDPWRVIVDFYARHDCDEYRMPHAYRPRAQAGPLPDCGGR